MPDFCEIEVFYKHVIVKRLVFTNQLSILIHQVVSAEYKVGGRFVLSCGDIHVSADASRRCRTQHIFAVLRLADYFI